ncbi:MAG: YceI family protein [Nitrospiraceae bacterium]
MTRTRRIAAWLIAITMLALPSIATAETWAIDPVHSIAGFSARHMMIANVHGTFEKTAGTIRYVPGDLKSAQVDIIIETASLNTRNAKRDNHLRSPDFLDAPNFPQITFKSKRVENVSDGSFDLVGDLTIRGTTKEVVLKVKGPSPVIKDPWGNRRFGASASATINRMDYGVNWNSVLETGGVVVGPEVQITIELEAVEKKG